MTVEEARELVQRWEEAADGDSADAEHSCAADMASALTEMADQMGKMYTREQVSQAMNDGVDLVTGDPGIYMSGRDHDLLNLVGNSIMTVLDNPGVDLNGVIMANYQPDVADEDDEPLSPDSEGYEDAVIATVREWVD